jgi:hypothetical protein
MTCFYCRQSTLSWLHRIGIAVVALTTVFYLLKAF